MRNIYSLSLLFTGVFFITFTTFSQVATDVSTKFFLDALKTENPDRPTQHFSVNYDLIKLNGEHYVGALAKVNDKINEDDLNNLDIITATKLKDLWTLRVPLKSIPNLMSIKGIDYIEISSEISPSLDRSLASTRVDSVHQGLGGLDRAYFGKGVIIAIIDWGFDYTHPNFYDTSLTNLRLSRAWDQNKLSGPAPNGYNFGTEYVGTTQLLDAKEDTLYVFGPGSHGTHVAGIAGGSGSGVINFGAAPESELIFISLRRDAPSLIDAFSYITNYAAAKNMPYVVNMSFGSHLGPHDGSSLKNYGIDILNGPGKIFVGSAGNNGNNNFHFDRDFSQNPDTVATVVNFDNSIDDSFGQTMTMWGSAHSNFSASILLVDNINQLIYETPFFHSQDEPSLDEIYVFGNDTLHIKMQSVAQHFMNNKPNIRFEVRNTSNHKVVLKFHSEDSHVHLWNNVRMNSRYTNWGMNLTANYPNGVTGNSDYGLGEPAGVGKNVITVGSYLAESYINETTFQYGNLSGFSSKGPTVDGRTKPDISSTGQSVLSSVNSYDISNQTGFVEEVEFNGKTYGFKRFSGTSMSGPMVAGIVALMLEAHPTLSATDAKEIIRKTARLDIRTGDIDPNVGTLNWGWGKANALAAILAAKTLSNLPHYELKETFFNVYPNPASDEVTIELDDIYSTDLKLVIYNFEGQLIKEEKLQHATQMKIDVSGLPNGMYIFQLQANQSISMKKVSILK